MTKEEEIKLTELFSSIIYDYIKDMTKDELKQISWFTLDTDLEENK